MNSVKMIAALMTASVTVTALAASARQDLEVTTAAAQPREQGAADFFTGTVHVVGRFRREAPARLTGAIVTFQPGAYTIWHSHPLGQTLIVTEGAGFVQAEGGQIRRIAKGDIVWTPPGVSHWHGATPTGAMTHIAIAEALEGENVGRGARVTPAEYAAAPK